MNEHLDKSRSRILLVAGTRPECLKLASVAKALRRQRRDSVIVMNSGQHRDMVDRSLAQLNLVADIRGAQCQTISLSSTLLTLHSQIRAAATDAQASMLVAQGDTSTAYATALAARDLRLPLAHVEAGLRTNHPLRPFPEEYFRRRIARLADLHFAPTETAQRNLLIEGVDSSRIHLVGNTAIDVLREVLSRRGQAQLPPLPDVEKLVTLTLHRRENYGRGLDSVCSAVLDLLAAEPDVGVVCPVHPNPVVGARIRRHLAGHRRIVLTAPLDYQPFITLLARSTFAITDSGGIQEEAPYLGTPILIVRENTERPETVALGMASLVSVDRDSILTAARQLCHAVRPAAIAFDRFAPYGDGYAGRQIARVLLGGDRMRQRALTAAPASLFAMQP